MVVLIDQLNLHEQIDRSPDRVQQAGKREVEEPQSEILRGGRSHEPFDRLVPAFDFPTVTVLREVSAPPIRHEHRILPVVVVFGFLFPAVDQRRLVPLVLNGDGQSQLPPDGVGNL